MFIALAAECNKFVRLRKMWNYNNLDLQTLPLTITYSNSQNKAEFLPCLHLYNHLLVKMYYASAMQTQWAWHLMVCFLLSWIAKFNSTWLHGVTNRLKSIMENVVDKPIDFYRRSKLSTFYALWLLRWLLRANQIGKALEWVRLTFCYSVYRRYQYKLNAGAEITIAHFFWSK